MHIEKVTRRPKEQVKIQVDRKIREIKSPQERNGFSVELMAQWKGDRLDLGLQVRKGWFSGTLLGALKIEDGVVCFDCEVPSLLQGLLGEERIRGFLQDELDELVD